jgi:hypothetical protein
VLNVGFDYKQEPNESASSSGVTLLDDFIRAQYKLVAIFGSWGICELKTDFSP